MAHCIPCSPCPPMPWYIRICITFFFCSPCLKPPDPHARSLAFPAPKWREREKKRAIHRWAIKKKKRGVVWSRAVGHYSLALRAYACMFPLLEIFFPPWPQTRRPGSRCVSRRGVGPVGGRERERVCVCVRKGPRVCVRVCVIPPPREP
ncbi:hypothetical protein LY76DRAFT_155366 [Colletotrichum caudatum]|nr:hypothetical protein LY76DRAFT_155366 [Colletotrichum caudatum]